MGNATPFPAAAGKLCHSGKMAIPNLVIEMDITHFQ
jgi:hypothetical protein